jgi:hypothetical protein
VCSKRPILAGPPLYSRSIVAEVRQIGKPRAPAAYPVKLWSSFEKFQRTKKAAVSGSVEVSRHLADQLGATPPFRADGNYELGELLPSVLARMKSLCGKAADAAQSWGNTADKEAATGRRGWRRRRRIADLPAPIG